MGVKITGAQEGSMTKDGCQTPSDCFVNVNVQVCAFDGAVGQGDIEGTNMAFKLLVVAVGRDLLRR